METVGSASTPRNLDTRRPPADSLTKVANQNAIRGGTAGFHTSAAFARARAMVPTTAQTAMRIIRASSLVRSRIKNLPRPWKPGKAVPQR